MVNIKDKATRYLQLTSLHDALDLLHSRFSCTPGIIHVPVQESFGRITAEPIFSPISVPASHLSAMDGLAVKSTDTVGATDQHPVLLKEFVRVNTGNVVPEGFDAVIMIEDVQEQESGYLIRSAAHPWQHIRPVGEDIAITEMILPRLSKIRSEDIGAMASYGITEVPVLSLKVALIPTGSEIIPIGKMPSPGQVIESNMHMAASLLRSLGVDITHLPIIPDDQELIRTAVADAVKNHDIVLISAGSSKGTKDYTARIIDELGEVFVHGVAIKPAKPVILGEISGKPVIGMPGYPIACHTILREIVLPLLSGYGFHTRSPITVSAEVTTSLYSDIGVDEFVLATVGKIQGNWVAAPLSRGSGVQMSMVRSNSYIHIPAGVEGVEAGSPIQAVLTVPQNVAEEVVLVSGSHDPVIDYLADLMRRSGVGIASSHIGSMGGLLSLKRGSTHLAPMHLLADDGEYNIPYLKKYLPGEDLVLICVAEREQGIVSRKKLEFQDVTQYRFINRQRGSGTRMLFDHLLQKKGILSSDVKGYEREVTTHHGVCLAIQSDDADIGIAVYSAAKAFSLNFLPIGTERYELVTTRAMFEQDSRIKKISDMIASEQFKEILNSLGGYQTRKTGVIRSISS